MTPVPLKEPSVDTLKSYPAVLTPPKKGNPEPGPDVGGVEAVPGRHCE